MYCSGHRRSIKSKSPVFITQPFTEHRYDKFICSKAHTHAAEDFREAESKKTFQRTVVDVGNKVLEVTEDEEAFKDLLRLMYFLHKQEIPHTTNRNLLRELCMMVGNTTLPRLNKSKRTNYCSEKTM